MTDAPTSEHRAPRAVATRRRNNLIVLVVLLFGLVVGLSLVVFGGGDGDTDGDPAADGPALSGSPDGEPETGEPELFEARGVLPLDDIELTPEGVEAYTGIVVPEGASGYLTGRLDNDRQLDVTFVFPADVEAAFLSSSQLAEPVEGRRVVLHGSALWELNPPEGVEVRGVTDTFGEVRRAVELVEESPGVLRARVVITTA